jgi:hypothetical protein
MSTDPRLPFELDGRMDESLVTGRAGVPLVAERFRASGTAGAFPSGRSERTRRGSG